jgi:cell wall-associated NlpC family hydrolase
MRQLRLLLSLLVLVLSLAWSGGARADDAPPAQSEPPAPVPAPFPIEQAPPVTQAPRRAPAAPLGARAAAYARSLLGVRYSYGGSSRRTGFDCSGLVRYVYGHFGVSLPHSSFAQFGDGRRVSRGALRTGDLVFFDGAGHVGLYVGGGRFIHAPHSGTVVQVSSLSGWYGRSYDGARRLAGA